MKAGPLITYTFLPARCKAPSAYLPTATSKSKDQVAKASLEMWELMLAHLDRQFDQLRIAMLEREDLEARRVALYNEAFNKGSKSACTFDRSVFA